MTTMTLSANTMTNAMTTMTTKMGAPVMGAPVMKARAYAGAGIILTRVDGPVPRVLCLRGRATGIWSFSKGHPENIDGRVPLRTAVRETQEETGLVAGKDYLIIGSSVRFGKRPYWIGLLCNGAAEKVCVARKEHDVAAWFSLAEVQQLRGNTDVRAWAKKAEGVFMNMVEAGVAVTSASPSLPIAPKH